MPRGAAGYENQYTSKGGFGDAYHKAQQRAREGKDYRKRVRDAELKELDEINGALVVPPSGQSGFDNSAQQAAMRWKKGAGEAYAKFKRGEMSAEEFSALKNDFAGRAAIFKDASNNLKKATADYDQALQDGTVSEATPDYVRDAFDSLRKGDGSFEIGEVDGQDVLMGTTAAGKEVSLPLNGLASGKNMLRFNQKVDLTPQKDAILKDLDSFKQQLKINDPEGFATGTLGWGQLEKRATEKVDNILQNNATLKSVAADEYGIDGEDPRWNSQAGIAEIRSEVQQGILNELEQQIIPRQTGFQQIRTQEQTSRATAADKKRGTATRISNSLQNSLNKYLSANGKLDQKAMDEVLNQIGGNKVKNIQYKTKSSAFGQFFGGREKDEIEITNEKGDIQTIPADPQGLINNVLRLEFGTAVDDTRNQIGGQIQQSNVDVKSRAAELIKKHRG